MNSHSVGMDNKKILFIFGCLVLLMILSACSGETKFKERYFEGKSDNWFVKMESKAESNRTFTISYIGEGNKPLNFKFEIYESLHGPVLGDGELKNQEEFEIDEMCSGACGAVPDSIPIQIQWEGKEEKVVIRIKNR